MAQFGEILSELRKDKRIKQSKLAEYLMVSTGTISNYENGVHFPDIDNLVRLADYFHVTTDYLLGRSSLTTDIDILSQTVAKDVTVADFIQALLQLSTNRRAIVLSLVSDMKLATILESYSKKK